jgi:type II secretory pathway component GspD/PulD (secretin)
MRSPRWLAGLVACAGLVLTAFPQALSAAGRQDATVTLKHKCVYIKAEHVAEELKTWMGAGATGAGLTLTVEEATNAVLVRGPADLIGKARRLLAEIDLPPQPVVAELIPLRALDATTAARSVLGPFPRPYAPSVEADERRKALIVKGTESQVEEIRAGLRAMGEIRLGPRSLLQTHSVPPGQAEPLAQLLQKVYKDDPLTKVTASGPASITVWAVPEWQREIGRYLRGLPRLTTETIPLKTIEAEKAAKFLQAAFSDVSIRPHPSSNALVVRGTKRQIQEVRDALGGDVGETLPGTMRVFTVKGSPVALAKTLREMLKSLRPNTKVELILPGKQESATPAPAPQPPQAGKKRPGKAAAQVRICAFGNKLIVTSDDPETIAFVVELVELLTRPRPRPRDSRFEVVRVHHTSAVETARILDESFNGTDTEKVRSTGRGMAMMPGGVPVKPRGRVDRIRVMADPSTNAVLVVGQPLDLLTIRSLLKPFPCHGEAEEGK